MAENNENSSKKEMVKRLPCAVYSTDSRDSTTEIFLASGSFTFQYTYHIYHSLSWRGHASDKTIHTLNNINKNKSIEFSERFFCLAFSWYFCAHRILILSELISMGKHAHNEHIWMFEISHLSFKSKVQKLKLKYNNDSRCLPMCAENVNCKIDFNFLQSLRTNYG